MPKESRRARSIRKAGRTKLDRRICPTCGAEVYRWDRKKIQRCTSCRQHFLWRSVPEVLASNSRGQPRLRYSSNGSPALSTIEECSESGDRSSSSSSGSSSIDDDERPLGHNSLRRSVDGNVAAAFASLRPDPKDDTVVGGPFDDPIPAHITGSNPPEEWRWPISVWEVLNQRNITALPQVAAVPLADLYQQNITAPPQIIAVPQLVPDTPRLIPPHLISPRATSPCPSSPRPIPKKKRYRFRRLLKRKRSEPIEPSPSLEDVIRIPEAVPRQRAVDLLNTLILARYAPGVPTEPITASPAIMSSEPDGILQQHAADLHNALVRLEALEVANDSDEESASSGRNSLWSRLGCFR